MAGYIRDYRQELDSKIWAMPPLYHRVWQYLKYKANFRETELQLKDGTMLRVERGQHFTSVRTIAKDVAWKERGVLQVPNPKMIDTVLNWMQNEEMVSYRGVTGNTQNQKGASGGNSLGTLITLINWDVFQPDINESNAKVTATPVTSNKKNKEDLNNISVRPYENMREEDEMNRLGDGVPTTDLLGEISPFKQIEHRYIQRRARGLNLNGDDIPVIHELLKDGIPPDTILAGIDRAFENHKPRYKGDRIMTFAYCDPVIREQHYRETAKGERVHAEIDRGDAGSGRASPAGGRDSTGTAERPNYYDQFDGLIQSL